jgi:hypothetical protein
MDQEYIKYLKSKAIIAEEFGFEPNYLPDMAKPHQKDMVFWGVKGGRRAYFASFGLGKTFIQLMTAVNCMEKENKPFLIACPLGVIGEFKRDNRKLGTGYDIQYITDTDTIDEYEKKIYLTNYERIRKGDIDPEKFSGVSFDEASVLRNLKTETTNYILQYFKKVRYRFVATATPSPNNFIELLNYAEYLGVADRGHLLTRFFKRNSTKAGDLQLNPNKKQEFWQWVSTWAVFINTPSDLGYDDTGYILPKMNLIEHCVDNTAATGNTDKYGNPAIFKEQGKGFIGQSREKRDSISDRVDRAMELIQGTTDNFIMWHHLEDERRLLEKNMKGIDFRSVFGSQKTDLKEKNLIDFSEGKYQFLNTKPEIAGSGCNFQGYCHNSVFIGINDKFNDFIQAIHRILRYGQTKDQVNIHVIYTINQQNTWANIKRKWHQHDELQKEMTSLVRKYGLNTNLIKKQMERQLFETGDKLQIGTATLYNNDNTVVLNNPDEIKDNSVGMILTSIPFGDHYEYSDFYNDYGHNHGNEAFFTQMDFLTPNLLRVLKPGHVCAVHVKDRIRYSYQNGTSFTTIQDFSGKTVMHYEKHGFYLMGKITITTDVVAENNQTYRLGYSEKCKDATKMGAGLPEYVLLFRKRPTMSKNAYSDEPVTKNKSEYTIGNWQLDAHSYWRSAGNRLMPVEELVKMDLKHVLKAWKQYQKDGLYDFDTHKNLTDSLDEAGKLSRKFMTIPPISNNQFVWDDIRRTDTLNTKQASSKKEKHICPLQLDLIERLINLFSNPGDVIMDPFGGLMSVPYRAMNMNRKSIGIELNTEYYKDGIFYIKSMHNQVNMPTLFDVLELKKEAV